MASIQLLKRTRAIYTSKNKFQFVKFSTGKIILCKWTFMNIVLLLIAISIF